MTATPLKGRLELKKQIAVQMRAECSFFWGISKAIYLQEKSWSVIDEQLNVALDRGSISEWMRDKLIHLRDVNAHRAGIQ